MKISVIGLGMMGAALAQGLLRTGYQVTVFNRTPAKALPLEALGAVVAGSAADAIRASEFTIVALMDEASTRAVLLEDAVRPTLSGRALISVAATTPEEIEELSRAVAGSGGNLAEVNVTAYPDPVREGRGEFNIASDEPYASRWLQIFRDLGTKVYFLGAVGNASRGEMALWFTYMFQTVSMAYALAGFEKLGLPVNVLQAVLNESSALRVASAEEMLPLMIGRKYGTALFSVTNFAKSCDMVIQYAKGLGLPTKVFEAIREIYLTASELGYGDRDVTAIYEALNPASNAGSHEVQ